MEQAYKLRAKKRIGFAKSKVNSRDAGRSLSSGFLSYRTFFPEREERPASRASFDKGRMKYSKPRVMYRGGNANGCLKFGSVLVAHPLILNASKDEGAWARSLF